MGLAPAWGRGSEAVLGAEKEGAAWESRGRTVGTRGLRAELCKLTTMSGGGRGRWGWSEAWGAQEPGALSEADFPWCLGLSGLLGWCWTVRKGAKGCPWSLKQASEALTSSSQQGPPLPQMSRAGPQKRTLQGLAVGVKDFLGEALGLGRECGAFWQQLGCFKPPAGFHKVSTQSPHHLGPWSVA